MKKLFPFEAAIFDLDGTLLDSMHVWSRVDEIYFEKRGMTAPPDYGPALAGKSYRESAEYTRERVGFPETWEEIVGEWTELAHEEYALRVELKPGAREYLTALKRAGVKLAVATALPEYLYRPCLERLDIYDIFGARCSTDDTGGRGKANGEVFLLAAQRLGVEPAQCAVFEDVLEGVRGAKRAGMRAYCVKDAANAHAYDELEAVADGMIDSYWDILPRRRCAIFTAHCEGDPKLAYDRREDDLLLCADAGYGLAKQLGLKPDAVIGDFDSGEAPAGENILRYPVIKDDTDMILCARYALEMGILDFLIVGGLGGRLDHTLTNLQGLGWLAAQGARVELCDGRTRVWALHNDSIRIPRTPGKLSLFALDGICEGIRSRGVKYPLEDGALTPLFPLGMGNDFTAPEAEIGVKRGTLLVIAELGREEI